MIIVELSIFFASIRDLEDVEERMTYKQKKNKSMELMRQSRLHQVYKCHDKAIELCQQNSDNSDHVESASMIKAIALANENKENEDISGKADQSAPTLPRDHGSSIGEEALPETENVCSNDTFKSKVPKGA